MRVTGGRGDVSFCCGRAGVGGSSGGEAAVKESIDGIVHIRDQVAAIAQTISVSEGNRLTMRLGGCATRGSGCAAPGTWALGKATPGA